MKPWKYQQQQRQRARDQQAQARRKLQGKQEPESQDTGLTSTDIRDWVNGTSMVWSGVIANSSSLLTLNFGGVDLGTLPVRQQVEPVVGWKRARLMRQADGPVRFFGATVDASYGAEAVAGCHRGNYGYSIIIGGSRSVSEIPQQHDHDAPGLQCYCGFYAVADQSHWEVLRRDYPDGFARLEVELYGKVIRYSQGYRAEKQRVLAAWIDPVCFGCSMWGQFGITRQTVSEMAGMVNAHGILRPVCAQCAMGLSEKLLLSLADISSDLGTEVRWWE